MLSAAYYDQISKVPFVNYYNRSRKSNHYCYYSVNVISFSLSQNDLIKRYPLYKIDVIFGAPFDQ
jgi:hypothetical protein